MSSKKLDELRDRLNEEMQTYQSAVDDMDAATAVHLGVNRTDLRCLEIVLRGPTSPSRLAVALALTTGSVTAMLDRLERLDYVKREPDPADRRKVIITVQPVVAKLSTELYGPLAEEGAKLLARYSAAELELITRFLERARDMVERRRDAVRELPTRAGKNARA